MASVARNTTSKFAGQTVNRFDLRGRKRYGHAGRGRIGHQPPGNCLEQCVDAIAAQRTGVKSCRLVVRRRRQIALVVDRSVPSGHWSTNA